MRLTTPISILLMLNALACHACSDEFDPASRVVNLRLLAVQADQPFARPGETVTLEALYRDPEGRALSWAWGPCDSAASSTALSCVQSMDLSRMTLSADPRYSLQVPERSAEDAPEGSDYLGIAVVVCPGTIVPGDTLGIPVQCLDAAGQALDIDDFEVGMKRIFVRDEARNQNPPIEMLLWDGERWPADEEREAQCDDDGECKKHRIEVRAPDAAEYGTDADGEPLQELVAIQFYGSGGTFEDEVLTLEEPETTWKPRSEDRGQQLTLWFVVRDDRGGVSWQERRLRVR